MRLRGGEFLTGAAGAALVLSLFVNWFETDDVKTSGWSGLSLGVVILIVLALISCAVVLFLVQSGAPLAPTMLITVVAAALTIVSFLAVTINVLTKQGDTVDLLWPALAGILFSAMLALGAWRSMGDERIDSPESAATPPEPRSIPGS
jgi:hypothetical protein